MIDRKLWRRDIQRFEADWWGDCANTYGEETKQIAYARVMGLDPGIWRGGDKWPLYDLGMRSILDVGGGPSSMLLKTNLAINRVVVDPCPYPEWVRRRYLSHHVLFVQEPAEDALPGFKDEQFDEAWCYNVLQHTIDPELIVREMCRVATFVRMFEWIDQPPHAGHPHELKAEKLNEWVGGTGQIVWLDEQYHEIGPESDSPVRQAAWGGVFG